MTQLRVALTLAAVVWLAACGPKGPPPNTPPPPTKASLLAEGKEKVKRALGYLEEMEQIRGVPRDDAPLPAVEEPPPLKGKKGHKGAKAAPPPPLPRPAGMDESAVMELDRILARARELKDQLVGMRDDLSQVIDRAASPIAGRDLDRARAVLARMNEKMGDLRDQRTRALELKPKPPEPEKKAPEKKAPEKKAPDKAAPAAKK
jgi:predicted small lipoprotein YifL